MKVTIYALHLGFGGVEKYVITLANILIKKCDVEIISTYKMVEIPSFPLDYKVNVMYLLSDLKPNKEELKKALKSKNIVSIIKEGYVSLKVLILKKRKNIKSIKQCNSDVIISTRDFHNHLIQKHAGKNIVKIATEHNHHNNDQKYIDSLISSCDKFDYMLPISRELTNFYQERLPNVDVIHIPFCIDTPRNEPVCTFNKNLINVGRLSSEKGSLELIDIFHQLYQLDNEYQLHVVGDGPLMGEVIQRIKKYKLEEVVHVHGFLYSDKIEELYAMSSVLMTSYTESFGFVLLEAMACGIPCIAFDSAQGANEIIKDKINGYLIEKRDINDYIEKIKILTNHRETYYQLYEQALMSSDVFTIENTSKGWYTLLEKINDIKKITYNNGGID